MCIHQKAPAPERPKGSEGGTVLGHQPSIIQICLLKPPAATQGTVSKGQQAPQIPNDSSWILFRKSGWIFLCSSTENATQAVQSDAAERLFAEIPKNPPAFFCRCISWWYGMLLLAATQDCAWLLRTRFYVACSLLCFICCHQGRLIFKQIIFETILEGIKYKTKCNKETYAQGKMQPLNKNKKKKKPNQMSWANS